MQIRKLVVRINNQKIVMQIYFYVTNKVKVY